VLRGRAKNQDEREKRERERGCRQKSVASPKRRNKKVKKNAPRGGFGFFHIASALEGRPLRGSAPPSDTSRAARHVLTGGTVSPPTRGSGSAQRALRSQALEHHRSPSQARAFLESVTPMLLARHVVSSTFSFLPPPPQPPGITAAAHARQVSPYSLYTAAAALHKTSRWRVCVQPTTSPPLRPRDPAVSCRGCEQPRTSCSAAAPSCRRGAACTSEDEEVPRRAPSSACKRSFYRKLASTVPSSAESGEDAGAGGWVDRFRQMSAKGPSCKSCCYCGDTEDLLELEDGCDLECHCSWSVAQEISDRQGGAVQCSTS
jgi:hypothetical protein